MNEQASMKRVRATAQALRAFWTATVERVPAAADSKLGEVIREHLEAVDAVEQAAPARAPEGAVGR